MASLVLGWLLGWLGFTAVGPAAGSIAAAWQASIAAATGGRQLFFCAAILCNGRSKPSQRCIEFYRLGGVAAHMFAVGSRL